MRSAPQDLEADPPEDGSDELIGRLLGDRYRVLRKLGQGGMGAVYLAEHELVGKRVALKVLSEELTGDRAAVERFILEARATARIRHSHIVDVHDLGMTDDVVYIAMEYLEGEDLYQTVRREGALPPDRARELLQQIARGLAAAHGAGIVHRDLKPENIRLVAREDGGVHVKLVDFGLAKLLDREPGARERLTRAGTVVGTPEYMSPEQVSGRPIDHRSDIYSLGCIAYELLSGQPPFGAAQVMDLLGQQLFAKPPPLPPAVPPDLRELCRRALEKRPERRFQSAEELLASISAPAAAMEPAAAVAETAPPPLPVAAPAIAADPRPPSRARLAAVLAGAALVPLLTVAPLVRRLTAPPEPARAVALALASAPPVEAEDAALAAAAPAAPVTAAARVVVRGTPGAVVLLNDRQRLGRIPLDVPVLLLLGAGREAAELVIRRRGCVPLSVSVVLTPGGRAEEDAALRCPGVARARGAHDRRSARRAEARPAPPSPASRAAAVPVDPTLRDPFR